MENVVSVKNDLNDIAHDRGQRTVCGRCADGSGTLGVCRICG